MKKRILIVDDAMFMRSLIGDILKKNGFEICGEASDAIEGIQKYKELKPDLITLDIVMPRMEEVDGITAVKQIFAIDPQAKILVISALAEKALVQQALVFGAKDFVTKPFNAEKLVDAVKKILGS